VVLLAGQTALWLWLGLATVFLLVLAVLALLAVALAVFDGDADDVADVQRFIALTEEARSLVPAGLPLFDGEKAAATTAALVRFQEKKDEARRALWASRDGLPRSRAQKPGRRTRRFFRTSEVTSQRQIFKPQQGDTWHRLLLARPRGPYRTIRSAAQASLSHSLWPRRIP
jgi:hypothetical protein